MVPYKLLIYVHLLAAAAWLGGMLFLAAVLVPLTRGMKEPPGAGARLLSAVGRRFRPVGWAALLVLVGTGLWILLEKGIGPAQVFGGRGSYYGALRLKLALVALVLVLSAIHDFVLGPRLARKLEASQAAGSGSAALARERRAVSWLARVNFALVLAIAGLGVLLR